MQKRKLGIFLYNRLFDPLIQSNFWLYILDFLEANQNEEQQIYLISYENDKFPITQEQKMLVEKWESQGLTWIQLRWNPGIGFLSKMHDVLQGLFAILKLKKLGVRHYVSLASIAGSYLYIYHLILRFNYFLYQYEPHSEYAIDNHMWKKNGYQYKIAHYLEKKAAFSAKVISSGTHFMQHRLEKEWKVKAKFFKIATVANDRKFLFSQQNRDVIRSKLGFTSDTRVLFYPGKFGDLYYKEETAFMFKWLWELDHDFHFLIVTPHNDNEVIGLFEKAGVERSLYTIAHSDYADIHYYFSAADFAVIAVPPGPSKKFISNIKVGEYLTSGLPYLITEGVSEDYIFAQERKVGVVVKDFQEKYIKSAYPEIDHYLKLDKGELRMHCRKAGIEYRGFDGLNRIFKEAINYLYSYGNEK